MIDELLEGIQVIDLSQGIAGPACTSMLADVGASVTTVEPPAGDWMGAIGPPWIDGQGAAAAHFGRGKVALDIDVSSAAGREALRARIAGADVLVHDLVGQAAADVGVDPASLSATNPRLVHCLITPLGVIGEWAGRPAGELEVQALSGLTSFLGTIGEEPVRIGTDIGAMAAANAGFQAVTAALFERERSGLGQAVTVSHLGALMALASLMIAAIDDPDDWEGFHCLAATNAPDHGITTRDGAVLYGQPLRSEESWRRFCAMVGADELLEDPRFRTRADRQPRLPELRRALNPHFSRFTTDEVMRMIAETDGTGAPLNSYDTLFHHPQARAIGLFAEDDAGHRLAAPWQLGPGVDDSE